jgi:sugar lactone lactonase YvrE
MRQNKVWKCGWVWLGLVLLSSQIRAEGLVYPLTAVASADGQSLFIADLNQSAIWKLSGGKLSVLFQASKKFRTPLNRVRCVALDRNGKLLAGDSATREVYRFDDDGQPHPLANGAFGIPMDLVVDPDNNIFVSDLEINTIWKIPASAGKAEKFAEVVAPRGMTIDADKNLWVISHGKNQLVRVTPDAKVSVVVEGRPWQFPHEVELDKDKTAFVTDGYGKALWKVPFGGKPEKIVAGEPLDNPVGLTWQEGKLLVIDPRAKAIFAVESSGKLAPIPAAAEKSSTDK